MQDPSHINEDFHSQNKSTCNFRYYIDCNVKQTDDNRKIYQLLTAQSNPKSRKISLAKGDSHIIDKILPVERKGKCNINVSPTLNLPQ